MQRRKEWYLVVDDLARHFGFNITYDKKTKGGFQGLKDRHGATIYGDWFKKPVHGSEHEANTIIRWHEILKSYIKPVDQSTGTDYWSFRILIGIMLLFISGICNAIGFITSDLKNVSTRLNLSSSVQSFVAIFLAIIWFIYYQMATESMTGGWYGIIFFHVLIFGVSIMTLSLIPENTTKWTKRTTTTFILYASSLSIHCLFFGMIIGYNMKHDKPIYKITGK